MIESDISLHAATLLSLCIDLTFDLVSIEAVCDPPCENNAFCQQGICMCPVGFTGPSCTEGMYLNIGS